MRGADAIVNALKQEGVEFVAGVTGGSTFELFDALHKVPEIKTIVCRHERCAVDIADGYARVTGRPGVALVVQGPGGANALAGVANSFADSVPVILLQGQVRQELFGRGTNQEMDLRDLFRTVTKWEATIPMVERIPEIMRRAFSVATAPRPRPVVVEIPTDVSAGEGQDSALEYRPLRQRRFRFRPDPTDIDRAVALLMKSERPVVLAGAGVLWSEAAPELLALAERLQVPVMETLAGLSSFPSNHPLSLGLGGVPRARYSTKQAIHFADRADLVLAVGAGFRAQATLSFRPLPAGMKVIQVNVDPEEFNKNYLTDVAILGDAKLALQDLCDALGSKRAGRFWGGAEVLRSEIARLRREWREEWMPHLTSDAVPINPHRVVWELMGALDPANSIVMHDSGSSRGVLCHHWECSAPKGILAFGNQSSMGWSVGAAIGAKLGAPQKEVVHLIGDGSFGMTGMEVNTAVRYGIKTVAVILNNSGLDLSRVQASRALKKGPDFPWVELSGDFSKVGAGLGAEVARVERPSELRPALERALAARGPVVLDVVTMPNAPEPILK